MTPSELRIGDCRAVMPEFPGLGSVDLVLTDPPYRTLSNGYDRTGRGRSQRAFGRSHDMTYDTPALGFEEWIPPARDCLRDTGALVCFECSPNLDDLRDACLSAGLRVIGWGVWVVWGRAAYSGVKPISKFDVWVLAGKAGFKMPKNHGLQDAYGGLPGEGAPMYDPPGSPVIAGQKPVKVLRKMIRNLCPPGGAVLDPFAGSGSTLRAAREEHRSAYGIEIRPQLAARIRSKALSDVGPLDGRWAEAA